MEIFLQIYSNLQEIHKNESSEQIIQHANNKLLSRMQVYLNSPICNIAFYLLPRYKKLIQNKYTVVDIKKMIFKLAQQWRFPDNEALCLKNELNLYHENITPFEIDVNTCKMHPTVYWNHTKMSISVLGKLARKVFSIVPHSASNEQLFSSLGIIKTKIRNRMYPSTLSKIATLRHNLKTEKFLKKQKA